MGRSVRFKSWPRWAVVVLLCVGYACFTACGYGGAVSSALASALGAGVHGAQLSRMLLIAATGVGCMAVRALATRGISLLRTSTSCVCYGCMGACTLLAYALKGAPEAVCLLAFMAGLAASVPLLLWFEGFLAVYEGSGPVRCLTAIAVASLLGRVAGFFSGILRDDPLVALAVILAGLAAAAVCQAAVLGVSSKGRDACGVSQPPLPPAGTYRLTVYMVILVASFGVTAGLSSGAVHYGSVAGDQGFLGAVVSWAAIAACCVVSLYAVGVKRLFGLHFGQFIRLSLVVAGVVFAFAPLLCGRSPVVLLALCQCVGVIQGIAMTLLSIEICYEKRLRMVDVMPLNYIVYVVATCIAMEVPALFADFATSAAAWSVVSAVAVTAVVVVIPALPSSSSTAATFALEKLPENESYEARAARAREGLAAKHGLSARETEVFELLAQGMTRSQIAERLALSSWTVKEYIAGVYGKVGVHSAKELMLLVAGAEKERRRA